MTKNCRGCHTHMDPNVSCSVPLVREVYNCPCRICLIKGVCEKGCVEYRKFNEKYNK